MPIAKAEKLIGDWKANGYNKRKTLLANGYSESMATKSAKLPINSAIKVLSNNHNRIIQSSADPSSTLLDVVGYTVDELIGHYRMIVEQCKDLPSKLKALQPLLATLGIKWNEEQVKVTVPTLNVTMEQPQEKVIDKELPTYDNTLKNKDEMNVA